MRRIAAVLILLLAGTILPASAASAYRSPYAYGAFVVNRTVPASAPAAPQSEAALLDLLTHERTSRSLQPLVADPVLAELAAVKSGELAEASGLSHISPTLGAPAAMLTHRGVQYRTFGENIGKGADVRSLHAMWMASPSHRANILNPNFNRVGIGLHAMLSGGVAATELFIGH